MNIRGCDICGKHIKEPNFNETQSFEVSGYYLDGSYYRVLVETLSDLCENCMRDILNHELTLTEHDEFKNKPEDKLTREQRISMLVNKLDGLKKEEIETRNELDELNNS